LLSSAGNCPRIRRSLARSIVTILRYTGPQIRGCSEPELCVLVTQPIRIVLHVSHKVRRVKGYGGVASFLPFVCKFIHETSEHISVKSDRVFAVALSEEFNIGRHRRSRRPALIPFYVKLRSVFIVMPKHCSSCNELMLSDYSTVERCRNSFAHGC